MDLTYIKNHWIDEANAAFSMNAWDSVADDYLQKKQFIFQIILFLQFLESKIQLNKNISVLDIGCGTGLYSAAIAPKAKQVVDIDFSPKMIHNASVYAQKH